jgi:ABC-2 type transport system ATP-binding protein
MDHVIETEDLTRRFGRKEAVRSLSFGVPSGSIYAFLGPNGAGKTTTIKMLMNIIEPSQGHARVLGTNSVNLGPAEFARIGYVSENQKLPGWMTLSELLAYCRPLYSTWDDRFCQNLLDDFDLPANERIKNFSRGMKIKAALLSSLAYRPRLLVLDEPFGGLDPLVRDELIRGILSWTEQESWTVFVSSQDIGEVERLADWVGFLNEGRLVMTGSVSQLQSRFRQVEVVTRNDANQPLPLEGAWLNSERAGRTIRFVDSEYAQVASEGKVRALFPDAHISFFPMSLREIFLALMRKLPSSASHA